jgi:ABC-type uncharacterized transport system permease subunit
MASTLPGFAIVAGVVAAALYALLMVVMVLDIRKHRLPTLWVTLAFALPALGLHGVATWMQIDQPTGLYLGFFTASTLVALIMAALVTLAAIWLPVQNLLILVLPIVIVTIGGSLAGHTAFLPRSQLDPPLIAHILVSIAAYGILFTAACHALVLTYQEHRLRHKRSIGVLQLLPPIETMESLLFALLWAGVTGLTLAIASGFAFLDDMFAQQVVHHTVLTMASWALYTGLLLGHYVFGWRSYTATYGTLVAFALLLLGYFGSKFVLEIVLHP